MKKIFLIRHGQTFGNKNKVLCGKTDTLLTEMGKENLRNKTINVPQDSLYFTSELTRTNETLNCLFPHVDDYRVEKGFNELDLLEYENKNECDVDVKQLFVQWLNEDKHFEPFDNFYKRVVSSYQQILELDKNCVIVTHHMVIRLLLLYIENKDKDKYFDITVHNGCGYEITYDNDKPISIKEI